MERDLGKERARRIFILAASRVGRDVRLHDLTNDEIDSLIAGIVNPPKHRYWGAGEPDCPRVLKAGNGELHTLRCKVCGQDDPRDDRCFAQPPSPSPNQEQ